MSNDSVNNEEQTTLEKTLIEKESTNTKTAVQHSLFLTKKTTGADSGAGGAGEGARGTQPLLGMNETRSGQNIRPRKTET